MKKNLFSNVVALSLILSNIHCHQKSTPTGNIEDSRVPASVVDIQESSSENTLTEEEFKSIFNTYPSSFTEFLKNKNQRLKLQPTLKQYSKTLPEDVYQRLFDLSKKVDDAGFTIQRLKSDVIFKNSKGSIKVSYRGPIDNIQMIFENRSYDFSKKEVLDSFITEIETRISKDLQKSAQISISPIFRLCLLPTLFLTNNAEAIATGWFILGGLALIAVAIAISAGKLGKSLKNTKHEVNVNHGVGKGTEDAINNLAGSINDLDPQILSNNTLNLTPPDIETTILPPADSSVTDGLGIQ